jgi:hypothetical protein
VSILVVCVRCSSVTRHLRAASCNADLYSCRHRIIVASGTANDFSRLRPADVHGHVRLYVVPHCSTTRPSATVEL